MSKFENYLKRFDIAANVTDEELEKTQALLQLYHELYEKVSVLPGWPYRCFSL